MANAMNASEINVAGTLFQEQFLILSKMNTTLIGMSFFKKNNRQTTSTESLLYLPDITLSSSELNATNNNNRKFVLPDVTKITLHPNEQGIVECSSVIKGEFLTNAIGVVAFINVSKENRIVFNILLIKPN